MTQRVSDSEIDDLSAWLGRTLIADKLPKYPDVAKSLQAICTELKQRRAAEAWRPVSETLPELSGAYLVADHDESFHCFWSTDGSDRYWFDGQSVITGVTHWRQIPPPPTEGGHE